MKRSVTFPVSCIFLFLTIWSLGCSEDEIISSAGIQESQQIEFATTINSGQFVDLAKKFDIETNEINFRVGEFSGGYTLRSKDINKELQNAGATFAENMSNVLKLSELNTAEDSSEFRQNIQSAIKAAQQNRLLFSGASVRVLPEVLSKMVHEGIITQLPSDNVISNQDPKMAPQSLSHETWAPYRGTTYVAKNCTFNTIFFDNGCGFDSNSTYEHETHLDKRYANYGYSWSSNLPRAYKDTQFLDNNGIDNFTVGCLQASAIQPYKEYFTYMALCPENNIKSDLWIKGQIGFRYPSWCPIDTAWCVPKAIATTSSMYKGTAPMSGGVSWGY